MNAPSVGELVELTDEDLACDSLQGILTRRRSIVLAAMVGLIPLEDALAAEALLHRRYCEAVYPIAIQGLFHAPDSPYVWQQRAIAFLMAADACGLLDTINGEDGW